MAEHCSRPLKNCELRTGNRELSAVRSAHHAPSMRNGPRPSAWIAPEAGAQLLEIGLPAGGHYFHVAVFRIAHPSAQLELAGFAMDEPAEAHTLHTTLYQKMKDHL